MKKNEMLQVLYKSFICKYPNWLLLSHNKREYCIYLGLKILDKTILIISFRGGPKDYRFGHGVGWTPNLDEFFNEMNAKVNSVYKRIEGTLERIRSVENPRDFNFCSLRVPITNLEKSFNMGFDLKEIPSEEIVSKMMSDIEIYAIPYLCLMLKSRHNLDYSPNDLK